MLAVGIVVGLYIFITKNETWGVKRCMQIMLGAFSVGCFLVLLGGRYLVPSMLGFLGVGIGFSGGYVMIPLMNGDMIDKDEDVTGLRREGMYAGVNSFITKPAISIAQAVFLWITTAFGYDNDLKQGLQSYSAETGIIVGWMLVPAILLLLCFVIMRLYPLAGAEWRETKARLETLHHQKEREFLEKLGFKVN